MTALVSLCFLLTSCSGGNGHSQEYGVREKAGKEQAVAQVPNAIPEEKTLSTEEMEHSDIEHYKRLQAVWTLWQSGAAEGAPDSTLEALELATLDPAVEVSGMAKKALAELRRLKEKQNALPSTSAKVENTALSPVIDPQNRESSPLVVQNTEVENRGTVEYIKALSSLAQSEQDEQIRASVVNEIGMHRSVTAVEALKKSISDPDPGIRYQALQTLWYSAADGLDKDGGITAALENALSDSDPQVASLAEKALADLRRLSERNEMVADSVYEENPALGDDGDAYANQEIDETVPEFAGADKFRPGTDDLPVVMEKGLGVQGRIAAENAEISEKINELADRVRFGADAEERMSAINELNHYRTDESVEILMEAAADADPGVRYHALQSLWYSAADGLDKDWKITYVLQGSLADGDPGVAGLAKQAVEDLKSIEEKKYQEQFESYSSPPPEEFPRFEDGSILPQ